MTAPRVALTLVTDRRRLEGRSLSALVFEAAHAGLDFVQVREKDLAGRALARLVEEIQAAVRGTATRVLVNGRADVALSCGAHGVQLPEEGLPVAAVRQAWPGIVIGASCHSLEAALAAEEAGADLVVLGPIFPTPGKADRALGVGLLGEAARRLSIPVHAIGGVDATTAARALGAGASGLAAIRAFLERAPGEAVAAFRQAERRRERTSE